MKKPYVFLFLLWTMIMTSCVSNDTYTKCLQYVYDDETASAIVSGIIPCANDDSTNIKIPSSIIYNKREYRVDKIGDNAFDQCSYITSVIIPSSVTWIGDNAFKGCTGLTSVSIPNSVTTIGNHAFDGCKGLTSVTIPNSVTSIGIGAFSESGLTSITIPNSIKSIAGDAFRECTGLTSVTIPNSVTNIGNCAFICCEGLTSVTIPNSVTNIGKYAFYGCTGLTSVTIPNSVTRIGDEAFSGCTGMTSIEIPNSVTTIEERAFAECTSLIIQIPERFRGEVDLSDCKKVIYTASESWLYGTWRCRTPYGTITVILQKDGRMYDSTHNGWFSYTIEGNQIVEKCNGYISTYNIDRVNKRFDCGEPGVWFYKY